MSVGADAFAGFAGAAFTAALGLVAERAGEAALPRVGTALFAGAFFAGAAFRATVFLAFVALEDGFFAAIE